MLRKREQKAITKSQDKNQSLEELARSSASLLNGTKIERPDTFRTLIERIENLDYELSVSQGTVANIGTLLGLDYFKGHFSEKGRI